MPLGDCLVVQQSQRRADCAGPSTGGPEITFSCNLNGSCRASRPALAAVTGPVESCFIGTDAALRAPEVRRGQIARYGQLSERCDALLVSLSRATACRHGGQQTMTQGFVQFRMIGRLSITTTSARCDGGFRPDLDALRPRRHATNVRLEQAKVHFSPAAQPCECSA